MELEEAKNIFKEINNTWMINSKKLVNPWNMFDCWAAQKRLLYNWIIWEMWTFNIITAQNLLKKWWYKEKSED